MRKRHIDTESPTAAVNLTPLLDMVFILLIFFIVTSSFEKAEGLAINRPDAATATSQTPGSISITVDDLGRIWMDDQVIDPRSVRTRVERLHGEAPERSVIVRADRESRTGILVEVVDQVRLAGVHRVSVAASPAPRQETQRPVPRNE
ncbi:MAG: biopolymer transporter ExbD [Gammaproteobacteria bacterium]|nr:biopolymer transporter ExbD [Gammaproteobacteria bacterium]